MSALADVYRQQLRIVEEEGDTQPQFVDNPEFTRKHILEMIWRKSRLDSEK